MLRVLNGFVMAPAKFTRAPLALRARIIDRSNTVKVAILSPSIFRKINRIHWYRSSLTKSFIPCYRQLHIAAVHGCVKSVATLIRICPNKMFLDLANDDGHTALHLAVMSGNAVVTRMLVHAGLSIEARDRLGETALHKASTKGNVECLQALLAPVPEFPSRKLTTVLNQKNYNGKYHNLD